ncbi:hypothetical protein GCM10025868_12230 [Angustibacter aerolatus]|uniref:Bacterial type II secretion system protein E domain-containing protein n=1 Tax=Angustibacter aerolatus TaxID=1162965 RepID=A0ABQ6JCQ9_9ACTN|nr:hypothetical protein [Angustibacter aerolatus]GMA85973.1 hypothetical protein GCM10025868_12230 [Angustibacter aerolatus]
MVVRRSGVDPLRERPAVAVLVEEVIGDYTDRALAGGLPRLEDDRAAARQVLDAVAGLGPLQPLLDDPEVEEIWVNEPGKVFAARHGRSEPTTTILTHDVVRDLVERMLRSSGRRIDLARPSSTRDCLTVRGCTW